MRRWIAAAVLPLLMVAGTALAQCGAASGGEKAVEVKCVVMAKGDCAKLCGGDMARDRWNSARPGGGPVASEDPGNIWYRGPGPRKSLSNWVQAMAGTTGNSASAALSADRWAVAGPARWGRCTARPWSPEPERRCAPPSAVLTAHPAARTARAQAIATREAPAWARCPRLDVE